MTTKDPQAIVASMRKEIAALDLRFVGEGVGVSQAIDELRKALDAISACLDRRDFYKASRLGYGPVAENFVFLQRAPEQGLQDASSEKETLVGEVAKKLRCAYEDALPYVDAVMTTPHPLTAKERRAARKALPKIKARVRAMTKRGRRQG